MIFRHLVAMGALTAVLLTTEGCCWRRCCRPARCCSPCERPACCDTAFYPPTPASGTSFGNPASMYAPPLTAGTVH